MYDKKIDIGIRGLGIILIILLFIGINYTGLDFDAAMNFQISDNLANKGKYMSNYTDAGYNGTSSTMFDHKIQTGATVIGPTAILNFLFGTNGRNMQIIAVIYLVVLLALIFQIVHKETNHILAFLVILYITPKIVMNSYNGYGEVITCMFMLLSFYIFDLAHKKNNKKLYYITGIVLGLGYLTKTVFLICIASYFTIFVFEVLIKRNKKQFLMYLYIGIGIVSPIFLFECYKLVSLGIAEYILWWKYEVALIFSEAGVSEDIGEHMSIINKVLNNIKGYTLCYGIGTIGIICVYSLPGIIGVYYYIKEKSYNIVHFCMYIVSVSYLMWWLFLVPSSRLWARRDLIGHTFIMVLAMLYIGKALLNIINKKKISYIPIALMIFMISFFVYQNCVALKHEVLDEYVQKQMAEETSEVIKQLPDEAVFYGAGWWQNPVLSIISGRKMENFNEIANVSESGYFVEDIYMKTIAPEVIKNMHSKFDLESIYENSQNAVYKIKIN